MDNRHTRTLSVLVGDDDVAVRESVVSVLAGSRFDIFTAGTGSDALGILLARRIDFSILDVEMPDMTGIEVVQRYVLGPFVAGMGSLPARLAREAMPTIFMSGNRSREIRHACETVGTTFLDKPLETGTLRAEIDLILQRLMN